MHCFFLLRDQRAAPIEDCSTAPLRTVITGNCWESVPIRSRERSTVNNDAEIIMMNRKRARCPAAVADVLITYSKEIQHRLYKLEVLVEIQINLLRMKLFRPT